MLLITMFPKSVSRFSTPCSFIKASALGTICYRQKYINYLFTEKTNLNQIIVNGNYKVTVVNFGHCKKTKSQQELEARKKKIQIIFLFIFLYLKMCKITPCSFVHPELFSFYVFCLSFGSPLFL